MRYFSIKYLPVLLLFFVGIDLFAAENILLKSNDKLLIAPEATSYQWEFNGEIIKNASTKQLRINQSGTYKVIMTDSFGMVSSQTISVQVDATGARRIILLGDSTCSIYDINSYPRTGWGQVFQPFFNSDSVTVLDYALSGRSSKSFYTDASGWPQAIKKIREGDFLFIQFGHNDEKDNDPTRYTEPYDSFQVYLSIYIDTALGRGAYPVLLTPIERNGWSGTSLKYSHGDYPQAMRDLAAEKGIPLIDLTEKTHIRWEAIGEDYITNNIYMNIPVGLYATYPEGRDDNTHLQEEGAWEICKMVAEGISEQKDTTNLGLLFNNIVSTGFVKVMPNPLLSGTFTNAGVIPTGNTVTIKANPVNGYAASAWKAENEVLDSGISFTYTAGDTLLDITCEMVAGSKVSVSYTPYKSGSVTGSGSYPNGTYVTLTATANEGYEFTCWLSGTDTAGYDSSIVVYVDGSNLSYKAVFSEIVSVIDQNADDIIKIFPNPAKDVVNIVSDEYINEIKLYNIKGDLLHEHSPQNKTCRIPLSYPSGIYTLSVLTNSYNLVKKILIQ